MSFARITSSTYQKWPFYISEHYHYFFLRRVLTKHITEITCIINHPCIKHHTHWSVEFVAERGAKASSLSSWNKSTGCRILNSTRELPRESWTGGPFAMVWRCYSETSTVQYIIHNIKRDVRYPVSSCENGSVVFDLEFPLPLPRPPQKKIHNLPKNVSPSRPPHHHYDPGEDSLNSPHLRINCVDLTEASCPGRIRDHVFVPSRTRISSPSCHRVGTRTCIPYTKLNSTRALAMGQDYPLTRPSPGSHPYIHPPSPALTWRGLPECRIPFRTFLFLFAVVFPMLLPISFLTCSKFRSRWSIPDWGGLEW